MPSTSDSLAVTAAAAQFSFQSRPILYTALGADAGITINAVVGEISEMLLDDPAGRTDLRSRQITVLVSDVPSPAHGDQLAVDGQIWSIDTLAHQSAAVAVLNTIQPRAQEISSEGYRRKI
jgi:hypothetical protein